MNKNDTSDIFWFVVSFLAVIAAVAAAVFWGYKYAAKPFASYVLSKASVYFQDQQRQEKRAWENFDLGKLKW